MELPTGSVYITMLDGEKRFITNADFESANEFGNFIYDFLYKNVDYDVGVYSFEYTKDNKTIYIEEFFKKD